MTLTEISNLTVTDKENQGQQQVKGKKEVKTNVVSSASKFMIWMDEQVQ